MYYPCSENKDADQLRGYREADLRLCFRLGKNPVFSRCGSFDSIAEKLFFARACKILFMFSFTAQLFIVRDLV